ncbi:MAG TPA: metallophosphoesterase family protein [Kofleriaceae bacterium]|jgi:hypothetical protein
MRTLAMFSMLLAFGCVKGNPNGSNDAPGGDGNGDGSPDPFLGGTIAIPGCGYSLHTREGASVPQLGDDTFGADPTTRLVHLGIMGDPKTSIVAQWRTTDESTTNTTARYGVGANLTADQLTQTVTGVTFQYLSSNVRYRMHQAHLCGLTAGTTYSYQVGGDAHWGPIYSFHTAPDVTAHPDATVAIGFVGDSRGGYDTWAMELDQIKSRSPDLILFSGDAVTIGITQTEWEDYFGRAESLFANVPVISAHGNHELNAINYYSQMALPGDQQNFGVDYGFMHVTVANDTPENPDDIQGAFHDAISADFTASDAARWKLFMHHQPMWSASTRHGSSTALQAAWQPLVDAHHIDLVLNGHDHDYEVTKPMNGTVAQTDSSTGTVYVVAGSSGAELYQNGTQYWTQYSEETYSGAIITISHDMLDMQAFRPDGTAIPTGFTKTK